MELTQRELAIMDALYKNISLDRRGIAKHTGSDSMTGSTCNTLEEKGLVHVVRPGGPRVNWYSLTEVGRAHMDRQNPQSPIVVEAQDLTDEEIDAALSDERLRFGDVETSTSEAVVRQRNGQDILRKRTLHNYGQRCAVCDVSDTNLLKTSHIIGWAERDETRGVLRNVICLCSFHDALFEYGYWSLDDQMAMIIQSKIDSHAIRQLLHAGCSFRKPSGHSPGLEFLRHHRVKHGLAPN